MNGQTATNKQITQDDVIYFVVTDRFFGKSKRSADPSDTSIHGGTLDGIIEKLDYLLELGVTAIWVTPVYENITDAGTSEPYHYYWPQNFDRMDQRLLDGTCLPSSSDIASPDSHPKPKFQKEREIFEWTRDLVHLRKLNESLKYGTTITLWSDDLVYAFLRISTDDVAFVIINNGYDPMPVPIQVDLNLSVIPQRVADMVARDLTHWQTGQALTVQNGKVAVGVEGKTIDVYCRRV